MSVRVANGKYTFIKHELAIEILRHGERWHSQSNAYNALTSMMAELDAARVVLQAARVLGDNAPPEIKRALELHRSLVDDNELPTEWTKP